MHRLAVRLCQHFMISCSRPQSHESAKPSSSDFNCAICSETARKREARERVREKRNNLMKESRFHRRITFIDTEASRLPRLWPKSNSKECFNVWSGAWIVNIYSSRWWFPHFTKFQTIKNASRHSTERRDANGTNGWCENKLFGCWKQTVDHLQVGRGFLRILATEHFAQQSESIERVHEQCQCQMFDVMLDSEKENRFLEKWADFLFSS